MKRLTYVKTNPPPEIASDDPVPHFPEEIAGETIKREVIAVDEDTGVSFTIEGQLTSVDWDHAPAETTYGQWLLGFDHKYVAIVHAVEEEVACLFELAGVWDRDLETALVFDRQPPGPGGSGTFRLLPHDVVEKLRGLIGLRYVIDVHGLRVRMWKKSSRLPIREVIKFKTSYRFSRGSRA